MLKATRESPRMFESDLFDLFSRTHPAAVPILFVPANAFLLWFGHTARGTSIWVSALLFAAGMFAWTFAEYWMHRTFFHWVPKARWGERFHFLLHGVHHHWPHDKYRLVMPPAVSISLFFLFLGLFVVVLGGGYAWGFHSGFVTGYVFYDLTHYFVHHYNPKSKYFLRLKKHHMLHHFKEHHSRYGVSSKLWDHVFGTQG
jgi:sterol desaturase/sphingolipid hydroxylase (fatty acid hydroxylase superfamily)